MFDVILASGGRDATVEDWEFTVGRAIAQHLIIGGLLIHGDARGIDRMSEGATEFMDREVERYPAPWNRKPDGSFNRGAGPQRNRQMLNRLLELRDDGKTVAVFSFHDNLGPHLEGTGSGTWDMAKIARRAGVPLYVFRSNGKVTKYE